MHQSTTPSLSQTIGPKWVSRQFLAVSIVQTSLPVTFCYSLSSEAVVMRQLRGWKRLWQRWLTHSHKRTSMGHSRSCLNDTTSALQLEEITSMGKTKKVWKLIVCTSYIVIHRQTVSLYHNSSVWLDMQDVWNWDQNPPNFMLILLSYCSASRQPWSARE